MILTLGLNVARHIRVSPIKIKREQRAAATGLKAAGFTAENSPRFA
jgi:hypothetical protein